MSGGKPTGRRGGNVLAGCGASNKHRGRGQDGERNPPSGRIAAKNLGKTGNSLVIARSDTLLYVDSW